MDYAWTFIVFKQGYGFPLPATESIPDDLSLAFSHYSILCGKGWVCRGINVLFKGEIKEYYSFLSLLGAFLNLRLY